MFQKRIVVLLLLIAVVAAVPLWAGQSAQAQDGSTVYCGQLSAGDCAILTGSQEAMASVTSVAVDADASFTISGFEITDGMDSLTVVMSVNGAAEADLSALNEMQAGMPTDMEGMTELMQDPNALLAMTLNSMAALEGLVDDSNAYLTAEFSTAPVIEGGPELISVEVRMTDGVLYVKQQPLADQLELDTPVDAEWAALDLGTALEEAFAEAMSELDLSELADMDMDMSSADMESIEALLDSDFFTIFSDPEFLNEFITVTRLDDAELNGQTMAVFETTLDVRDLLLSPAFSEAIFGLLEDAQALDPEASEELGVAPAEVQLILTLVGSMFTNAEVTSVQWVGVDDLYTYHTEASMNFEIDLSLLTGSDPTAPQSIALTGNLRVDLSNFNEPVEVTVPDDVEFYDMDDLQ